MFSNSKRMVLQNGLYRSTWGETVTYYGLSTSASTNNDNNNRNDHKQHSHTSRNAMAPMDATHGTTESTTKHIPVMSMSVSQQSSLTLPKSFAHLQDVSFPVSETDIPLFWHMPRSAGK